MDYWQLNDGVKGSGRTTRMLEFAIEQARKKQKVWIYGNDHTHTKLLQNTLNAMLTKRQRATKWRLNIKFLSFNVIDGQDRSIGFGFTPYDFATGEIAKNYAGPQTGCINLVDHAALQRSLKKVRTYLESARHIPDTLQWLGHTALMLTSLGKSVTVVTQCPDRAEVLRSMFAGFPDHIRIIYNDRNINWLRLQWFRDSNDTLLFDPHTVQAQFDGALLEMHRWNA
jgi:hypothetical protein